MGSDKELIVVAAPSFDDDYYAEVAERIIDFHFGYAKAVEGKDDFLVLATPDTYDLYVDVLGQARVALAPQADIWMRDFSLSNAAAPIMFRYTAEGQGGGKRGQREADEVQETLAESLGDAGLVFDESEWLNDGGNWVDDYAGSVVISDKFLRDNAVTQDEARKALLNETSAKRIAFIEADEQGGLEHADGVVAFLDANTLVINSYPEDPDYAANLKAKLLTAFPDVTLHEIVTPYDPSAIYDDRFGSACGFYTNMLVTPQRIYLPQFGIPEDAQALKSVRGWTEKEVVPVRSDQVCFMGGGVRCMSWQVRGKNAKLFKAWAAKQRPR